MGKNLKFRRVENTIKPEISRDFLLESLDTSFPVLLYIPDLCTYLFQNSTSPGATLWYPKLRNQLELGLKTKLTVKIGKNLMISSTLSTLPLANGEFIKRPLFNLKNLRCKGGCPPPFPSAWRFQKKIEKARSWKSGSELARIHAAFCRDWMSQKNSFFSFWKLAVQSMIHKQEQENWDFGNTEIKNSQQLLYNHLMIYTIL